MSNQFFFTRLIEILFIVSTSLSLVMVLAHASRRSHWIVRMFDFPVKQMVVFHFVLTCIMLSWVYDGALLLHIIPMIVGGICILILCYTIWPYTILHKKDLRNSDDLGESIKLISANVFMDNTEYTPLFELVRKEDPDCLLLLETNARWDKACRRLEKKYPYHIKHPLENTYGLLFYSKLKIASHEVRFLLKDDIPSIKAVLETDHGKQITFYGLHPEPPSPTESDTSTPRDIELLKVANEVKSIESPIICTGDFNDVAWSHTSRLFRRYSGLLDPRIGRGSFSTFNTKFQLLRWPLDHFFVSSHFTLNNIAVLSGIGSDHFPIMIDVKLRAEPQHEEPEPIADDIEEVKSTLSRSSEFEA